jgi:hypothetical protein
MTSRRILPTQMLLEIAETGGAISADMEVIGARFGLARRYASQYMHLLVRRRLVYRDNKRSIFTIAPKGLAWLKDHPPFVAKPPPPGPTPAPPRPIRDRPHDRMPALTKPEMLLRKQDNEIHILRTIRHFNRVPDNTEHLDRGRLYLDREQLGADLRATVEEYLQFKAKEKRFPSSFIPGSLTERQAKAIQYKVNRPVRTAAESKRKQAKAAAKVATRQTVAVDCRASAVYLVLTDQPQTMVEIMDKLACSPAFRTVDGSSLLTGGSLKKAIQRAFKEKALAARLEIKRDRLKNGRPLHLFWRRR